MVTSLMVSASTVNDSQRMRQYMDTLLRSMELPYFIIEKLSEIFKAVARQHGWGWSRQENFKRETVYYFQKVGGSAKGRLVVSDAEFKSLWLLEKDERLRQIEERLFGRPTRDLKAEETLARDDEYLDQVVRQAVFEDLATPAWVSVRPQPDGTRAFMFRQNEDDSDRPFLRISSERRDDLQAQIPIRRYAEVATEAKAGIRLLLDQ
jgi:hypothetical protein